MARIVAITSSVTNQGFRGHSIPITKANAVSMPIANIKKPQT